MIFNFLKIVLLYSIHRMNTLPSYETNDYQSQRDLKIFQKPINGNYGTWEKNASITIYQRTIKNYNKNIYSMYN